MASENELQKSKIGSAYVLAMAVSKLYPAAQLGTYTLTEDGFAYDFYLPTDALGEYDLQTIETEMKSIVEKDLPLVITSRNKDEAHDFYVSLNQPFKLETIDETRTRRVSFIVIGNNEFVDIGKQTGIQSTRQVGVLSLRTVAGAYWKGNEDRQMLTRIYGVSFPSQEELDLYIAYKEEAIRRDHKAISKRLSYTLFDPGIGQGLPVFRPRGAFAIQELRRFIENVYGDNDFMPISSPRIALREFWKSLGITNPTSLLYENIKSAGRESISVSPTNAPFHILSFCVRPRSYRDLPWSTYEVSQVYRKEKAADLSGLYTTRQLTLDENYTICAKEQLDIELESQCNLTLMILRSFGLNDFEIHLHGTPSQSVQESNMYSEWEDAVAILKNMVRKAGYGLKEIPEVTHERGPKIYIMVRDAVKRFRQISSLGLDVSLPRKMDLEYTGKDGQKHMPFVIRRSILGSLERFLSVLLEQTVGNLPLWLQFEKCRVIPITNKNEIFAETVLRKLSESGIKGTIDYSNEPLDGKIKQAEEDKIPYSIIVGEKEQKVNGISVRVQGIGDIGLITVDTFVASLQEEIKSKSIKTLLV